MPKGIFITLDGIDGTGKSTQCRMIVDRLRAMSLSVTTCVDPGGTELGAKIREILLFGREHRIGARAEALLFMASRAELVDEIIRPALERGEIVVSDRFVTANVVYQGYAGGLDPERLRAIGAFSTGDIEPDLVLILDLPIETARERRGRAADRVESRNEEYHRMVREGFLLEVRTRPEKFHVVDAASSVEVVHEQLMRRILALLDERLPKEGS